MYRLEHVNGIGNARDGQASGITAFLSAIGRLNKDEKRDPLGDRCAPDGYPTTN
jgi:hypothetical protein